MSRTVSLIKLVLQFTRPWAVGGVGNADAEVDLPILLDPRSTPPLPYLPPTSLVGALREHLTAELGAEASVHWLGPLSGKAEERTGDLPRIASRLCALGTRLHAGHALQEIVSTSVDPCRRSAAAGTLRIEQRVAPSNPESQGSKVDWYLTVDEEVPRDLVEALASWSFFVGRGRTRGLGQARVQRGALMTLDLASSADLTWWLTERSAWLAGGDAGSLHGRVKPVTGTSVEADPVVALDWLVEDPLAVGRGVSSRAEPASPRSGGATPRVAQLREMRRDGRGQPIIPGTAWKGVFRQRATFILTAVLGLEGQSHSSRIVADLFGDGSNSRTGEQTGRRGMLRFVDSPLRAASGSQDPRILRRTHVAIDRITGGAARGLLFTVEAVAPNELASLRIDCDAKLPPAYLCLLRHVVRDLHEGLIGVGGMNTRGYGSLRLADPATLDDLRPLDASALRAASMEATGATESVDGS